MDEKYLLPFFTPEVQEGQINALPPFHFYIKITDSTPPIAFTGLTVKNDITVKQTAKEIIRNVTREKHGRQKEIVEKEIESYFNYLNPVENKNEKSESRKDAEHYYLIKVA